jgi:hypothetical protein
MGLCHSCGVEHLGKCPKSIWGNHMRKMDKVICNKARESCCCINKELAELLGLPINQWKTRGVDGKMHLHSNPDFTSSDGKIELLRLMMKRGDWDAFLAYLYIHQTEDSGMEAMAKYITDTTGRLAQAAREWLTAQKEV